MATKLRVQSITLSTTRPLSTLPLAVTARKPFVTMLLCPLIYLISLCFDIAADTNASPTEQKSSVGMAQRLSDRALAAEKASKLKKTAAVEEQTAALARAEHEGFRLPAMNVNLLVAEKYSAPYSRREQTDPGALVLVTDNRFLEICVVL